MLAALYNLLTKYKISLLIIIFMVIGIFLRFYNLNWGAPFHFHPDERNIASAVTQLSFPNQMNPKFFAYGSLPIYAIYFAGIIQNFATSAAEPAKVLFSNAILISRLYSAIFSVLLIPLVFIIGQRLKSENTGLLAASLTTFSTGLIQFAHFGTFEMWLTFFGTLLFFFCLKIIDKKEKAAIFWLGIICGTLIAAKISSIALLPLPLIAIFLKTRNSVKKSALGLGLFFLLLLSVFIISNPFVFSDFSSFQASMNYESTVVTKPGYVFYTGGFYNTVPVVFQFLKIFPFLLNPLLTVLFLLSLIYLIRKAIETKKISYLILTTFYLILFLSQAFLFAKWTRYMVPTLPFIYLIISVALLDFMKHFRKVLSIKYLVFSIVFASSAIFSISYFITVFVKPDARLEAVNFAQKNIPQNAKILSEPYDLGLVAFEANFTNVEIFSFYDLDSPNISLTDELKTRLNESDYIVLPSQRLYRNRIINKEAFPTGNAFYQNLVNEELGYKKIYETPCDTLCKIAYLGDPIFYYEETASVFDRPTVMIFKRDKK